MRKVLMMGAALGLLGVGFGCSRSFDRARADYHQDRAQRAASRGDYYKAADQQRKADIERHRAADRDVLP